MPATRWRAPAVMTRVFRKLTAKPSSIAIAPSAAMVQRRLVVFQCDILPQVGAGRMALLPLPHAVCSGCVAANLASGIAIADPGNPMFPSGLRDLLAEIYRWDQAWRVTAKADIQRRFVDFNSKGIICWQSVLDEAIRQQRLRGGPIPADVRAAERLGACRRRFRLRAPDASVRRE
jgi:hypothetical protein